jgi:hypothetical protein
MAENITLSREWKQSLTTSKMQPFAMQVSLWDLLFFEDSEGTIYTRYILEPNEGNWKCKGYELPHSIIVFDEKIYQKADSVSERAGRRSIKQAQLTDTPEYADRNNLTTFDKFSSFGFDLSLPYFDPRTKPLFLKGTNVSNYISSGSSEQFAEILSAIKPKKLASSDFYYIAVEQEITSSGFKIYDKEAALKPKTSYDFYTRSALKPLNSGTANSWLDYPDPWYIACEEDYSDVWETPEQKNIPGTAGADIIVCSRDTSFEKRFIIPDSGFLAYNTICLNYSSDRVWKNLLKYYSATVTDYNPFKGDLKVSNNKVTIDPILNFLIKNCYLWVKCAFFADYIDYRDFNQPLNEKSQVIHDSMILGKGNFKRFNEAYSANDNYSFTDYAKGSRPYFPTTTPDIDLVRNVLLPESKQSNDKNTLLKNIIEDSLDPNSLIGSVEIEPFEDYGSELAPDFTTAAINDPPPIWFDPASRKQNTDYNDTPVLIGKTGNLITTGRLFSPTIDELWYTIKELIAGKNRDSVIDNAIEGYPKNNSSNSNSADTRFTMPTHQFKDLNSSTKKGDPVQISLKQDEQNSKNIVYRVEKWVSNPDYILYRVIETLRDAINNICSVNPDIEATIEIINGLPEPSKYLPSATVPSLRELEALIKGLRWNLEYYINFLTLHGVYIGKDGKPNSDSHAYNKNNGTAYLLHKDTDVSGQNPNTVYDDRYNVDLTLDRYIGLGEPSYGKGLGQITEDMFADNDQDLIPSHTVFMSAAGTWQSVSQCINIRIRNDEDW